jgi:4-aminobutyrate aminotransferase / (S)-3-amino-2-methylpropionate transaminase / 5-aminovalerate transaminase
MSGLDERLPVTTAPPTAGGRFLRTSIPGPRSVELAARRAAALPDGVGVTLPVFIARGSSGILEDVDGNRFIDFGSGIAVTNVGNSAPAVVEAVSNQAAAFTHTCFQVTPYESYVAVCERLNALSPGSHEKRSFLVNSGAEAVENAVKIARYTTGRGAVVAFDHGFHGRTLLTMSLTGKAQPYKRGFGPFAPEVYHAPYSYPFRGTGRLEEVLDLIETTIGASSVACILVEPIAGEGGFIVPEPGWLAGLAEWCHESGSLFVVDEVQSGMGRTGKWFACDHEGVVPDIMTTAKSLGGGLPIGGITGRADVMDSVHRGGLGGTFGGNPLSCAAALAVFDVIESQGLLTRASQLGDVAMARFGDLVAHDGPVGEVRGRGAMIAIELVRGDRSPDPATTQRVAARCHEQGLMVLTAGTHGNVIRLLPPLVIADDLFDEGLDILADALQAV